jgi:hypothetical protein
MRRLRFGDLFEQVASLGNLFAAAKKALRGRVGLVTTAVFSGNSAGSAGGRRRIRRSVTFARSRRRSHRPEACTHKGTRAAGEPSIRTEFPRSE